ncbi:hypothetical protein ACOMHN_056174 [Nucella lapillus]
MASSSPSSLLEFPSTDTMGEEQSWASTRNSIDPHLPEELWSSQSSSSSSHSIYNLNVSFNNHSGFNNQYNNSNDSLGAETLFLSEGAKAGLIVLYTLTTLLSISGNILVVLVFMRGRRCRTDIRPFLINLAVADLVMAIFCMPFTFTFVMMKNWPFSKPMCPVVLFMQHLSVSASVFTNVAIGSDRFLVVMFPLKSRVTTARAKYVLGTIWLLAVALSSVQLVVGRAQEGPGDEVVCDEVWHPVSARRTFTMFVLFITYIIPLTILAVAYSIVGVLLWRRSTPGNADHSRDLHQLQAKRKCGVGVCVVGCGGVFCDVVLVWCWCGPPWATLTTPAASISCRPRRSLDLSSLLTINCFLDPFDFVTDITETKPRECKAELQPKRMDQVWATFLAFAVELR